MDEDIQKETEKLEVADNALELDFRAFEIKTIRCKLT